MDFKKSETLKNLTRAFVAECQDGAKYQFIADMATQEQQAYVSTILKQLATNEMAHAKVFYDTISDKITDGVDMVEIEATFPMLNTSYVEMLKIKAENEQRQADFVYQQFAKTAREEGFADIAEKFEEIAKIEACHAVVLFELYDKHCDNKLYSNSEQTLWKCTNCGHEGIAKKGWKKCPLCNAAQGNIKINLNKSASDCNCDEDCLCEDDCSCTPKDRCSPKCSC